MDPTELAVEIMKTRPDGVRYADGCARNEMFEPGTLPVTASAAHPSNCQLDAGNPSIGRGFSARLTPGDTTTEATGVYCRAQTETETETEAVPPQLSVNSPDAGVRTERGVQSAAALAVTLALIRGDPPRPTTRLDTRTRAATAAAHHATQSNGRSIRLQPLK
jgi:hypothetical protein